MVDIANNNPSISDFDRMISLCNAMSDVPKKDGCFEFIAQAFGPFNQIDINKAREACNYIKGFDGVKSKEGCYKMINENEAKKEVIKNYLEENIWKPTEEGKTFCAYRILGGESREESDADITQYLWVLCEDYSFKDGKLKQWGGTSLPATINLQKENHIYRVVSCKIPGSGTLYLEDIKKIS